MTEMNWLFHMARRALVVAGAMRGTLGSYHTGPAARGSRAQAALHVLRLVAPDPSRVDRDPDRGGDSDRGERDPQPPRMVGGPQQPGRSSGVEAERLLQLLPRRRALHAGLET